MPIGRDTEAYVSCIDHLVNHVLVPLNLSASTYVHCVVISTDWKIFDVQIYVYLKARQVSVIYLSKIYVHTEIGLAQALSVTYFSIFARISFLQTNLFFLQPIDSLSSMDVGLFFVASPLLTFNYT